jgi:hypothetical protein
MASLVHALKSDCAAAASGTVEFYSMGTATLSTLVYSDPNGVYAVSPPHTLSASGRITRYVGEPVDVVIKSSAGATVDTFTHIEDARVVRLESAAFTGPNTNGNGQVVAGGRTTEAAAWTLLGASLGSTDGNTLSSGDVSSIEDAIGGVFIDVSAYGTDPTGLEDSTTAIANAMTAAATATGSLVYFPPGTYKTTAAITVPANTWVMGSPSGPGSSGGVTIKQYTTAILGWFTVAANATDVLIENIKFAADNAAHTGRMISASGGSDGRVTIRGCSFGAFAGDNVYAPSAFSIVNVETCYFASTGETQDFVEVATPEGTMVMSNCYFIGTGGLANFEVASSALLHLSNCVIYTDTGLATDELFDVVGRATVTGGSIEIDAAGTTVIAGGGGTVTLSGVRIHEGTGSGTVYLVATGTTLYESGCVLGGSASISAATLVGHSQWRDHALTSSSATTVSHTPNAGNYGTVMYTQTGNAAFAWNNPTIDAPVGSKLRLVYYNTSGGNITSTFGTAYGVAAVTITNNNQCSAWEFVRCDVGATVDWVCVGPQTVFTP